MVRLKLMKDNLEEYTITEDNILLITEIPDKAIAKAIYEVIYEKCKYIEELEYDLIQKDKKLKELENKNETLNEIIEKWRMINND